jgi:hypothetical protein
MKNEKYNNMLKLYTNPDIKKNKNFIVDPNYLLLGYKIIDNEYNRNVIREIDKGTYLDEHFFIDRVGQKLSLQYLSTSAKILLAIPVADGIINGTPMGNKCGKLFLQNTEGNIYMPVGRLCSLVYGPYNRKLDLSVDGVKIDNYYDYIEYVEELY